MLIRFKKDQTAEWHWGLDCEGHGWYAAGQVIVGEVIRTDEQGVWLRSYSDDDMVVIVEPEAIEILSVAERWHGPKPTICELCKRPIPIDCFFRGGESNKVMCHKCWPDSPETSCERFELDKETGEYVCTLQREVY